MFCVNDVGKIVKAWRKAAGYSSRGALAEALGMNPETGRQNIANLENGATTAPAWLYKLTELMGYASPDQLLALMPPPNVAPNVGGEGGHLSSGVAHPESLQKPTLLETVTWEAVSNREALAGMFLMKLPDDALAPKSRAGLEVIWSTTKQAKPGAPIIVRDRTGATYVRKMHEGSKPGTFVAAPSNPAYRTLDSELDGLTVVAVWHGRIGEYDDL